MSSAGAVRRAAVPVSKARAEASRRNGAKSRGPKTPAGKARPGRNLLRPPRPPLLPLPISSKGPCLAPRLRTTPPPDRPAYVGPYARPPRMPGPCSRRGDGFPP